MKNKRVNIKTTVDQFVTTIPGKIALSLCTGDKITEYRRAYVVNYKIWDESTGELEIIVEQLK